jgi:hypothetical protein
MILYLKDPKNSTPKLLDTIKSFSNVSGYKINLQKSVAFLYTNNEQIEKEYTKTIPFKIASIDITTHGSLMTLTSAAALCRDRDRQEPDWRKESTDRGNK